VAIFIMPIAVQCGPSGTRGRAGGGSYIAQRMLASKSEKDSLGPSSSSTSPTMSSALAWILVGLCSLIIYPNLSDIQRAFPHLDRA